MKYWPNLHLVKLTYYQYHDHLNWQKLNYQEKDTQLKILKKIRAILLE